MQHLDLTEEALQLTRAGRDADLQLRMLGSTAVAAKCRAAGDLLQRHNALPKDIDLAALSHQRRRVRDFLHGHGLRPPMNGVITPYMDRDIFIAKRGDGDMRVEVFFDELRFVHRIIFVDDFVRSFPTLPLDTLVMSKLQMRRRSLSDWLHLAALLIQGATEDSMSHRFDPTRITKQAESDYRCWRDFITSLEKLSSPEMLAELRLTETEGVAMAKGVSLVSAALNNAKHGPRWFVGRIKASLRLEPPEPEVAEYWDAG